MAFQISINIIRGIKTALEASKTAVILGHHNPDGDAVGGSTALFEIIQQFDIDTNIVMPSNIAKGIQFMPNVSRIVSHENEPEKAEILLDAADIIFCVDFNGLSRVGRLRENLEAAKGVKVMLDHHPQPEKFVDFMISSTEVSSASEIVFEFISASGFESLMTENCAESLFTGIMTDTNNFSVNCSRSRTWEIVAKLLATGVERERIYNQVYNNHTEGRMRLSGYFLDQKMKIYPEYQTAVCIITKEEKEKYGFEHGDQEGFVNLPLSISEVETSIFILENDDVLKISLRSKSDFDVNLLARKFFNGGGHQRAAGGKLYMPVERVEGYVLDKLRIFRKLTEDE